MNIIKKERFQKLFRQRYSLRFHMGAILFATALSGVLISKFLLVLKVNHFALRYGLAVVLSYIVFFVCIKFWLIYVSPKRANERNSADWLIVPIPSSSGSVSETILPVRGAGGEFSGAGASGCFDVQSTAAADIPVSTIAEGTAGVSGIGNVVDGASDAIGDEGGIAGIIVLAVLAVFVAVISGAAIYVIIEAPIILSEAAFEAVLAAALVKNTRLIDGENWMGSVFKATWKPFAITLAVAIVGALVLHAYFPHAHRLADILKTG